MRTRSSRVPGRRKLGELRARATGVPSSCLVRSSRRQRASWAQQKPPDEEAGQRQAALCDGSQVPSPQVLKLPHGRTIRVSFFKAIFLTVRFFISNLLSGLHHEPSKL